MATIHGKDLAEAREKLGQDIDKIFKRKIVIKSMGNMYVSENNRNCSDYDVSLLNGLFV